MFRWNRRKQKKVAIKELEEARNIYDKAVEHYERGELKPALEGYRDALAIEERLDPDSLNIAATYNQIGLVLHHQGDLEGAQREYRRALTIQEREAPDSLTVATTYNNLGTVLYNQGDLEGALRKYRRALAIREREAPDSLTVGTTYHNIGGVLQQQGDLEGALRELRRALTIEEREAPDSLTVATTYNNIGGVLKRQGDLEGALREYRRSLAIREREAPDSVDVATSYGNIGSVLYAQGDLEGALREYRRALTIQEREAPDSLDVATTYNNIGLVLDDQGDLEGALREHRRALTIHEREAPDSLMVATSYNNIGWVLKQQGDMEGALREYQRALTIEERKAPDSPALAQSLISIGSLLKDEGDLNKALPYFERSHEILRRPQISLSPRHPTLITCKYELGNLLLKCRNDYEKGLQLADEIIEALPEYKWAYTLKAQAQVGLGEIQAAVDTYNAVISLAPNYADAHAGRLQTFVELEKRMKVEMRRKEEEHERFMVRKEEEHKHLLLQMKGALHVAKDVDPKAHEEVDDKIQKLFREESRKDNLSVQSLPKQAIATQEELLGMMQQLMKQNEQLRIQMGQEFQGVRNTVVSEAESVKNAVKTEIGQMQKALEASINNIPDFIVEMENVHCPYLFQIITKDEFEAFQNENEQQMDTYDGVLDALNRAERLVSKANEILEDYVSGNLDLEAKARKGALNMAWQKITGKKQEDFYLQLLCGWTFKPVVSYKIKSTTYSEDVVKFAQLGAKTCAVAIKVSILWNVASDTARMFGYPLPTIPKEHAEKARDFLSGIDNSTEIKDLKEKEREGFSLAELDEFGSFLEERKAKMCHMHNIFDKDKLKDTHWSEALKKQATEINGKTHVTYVSTEEASRLESTAILKSQHQRAS